VVAKDGALESPDGQAEGVVVVEELHNQGLSTEGQDMDHCENEAQESSHPLRSVLSPRRGVGVSGEHGLETGHEAAFPPLRLPSPTTFQIRLGTEVVESGSNEERGALRDRERVIGNMELGVHVDSG